MARPPDGWRRVCSVATAWLARRAHAAYLALPPWLLGGLQRLWPARLRGFARRRLVPLLHGPLRRVGPEPQFTAAATGEADGVTVVGYLHGAFGVAQGLRAVAGACAAAAIPVEICDLPVPGREAGAGADLERRVSAHRRYATQIHCVNADGALLAAPGLKRAANPGKYRIGSWFWELERFPAAWSAAFDEIDELWAASPFIEAALSAASPKPVISMPLAVEFALPRAYTRREFGLPEDCFVCLFAYDFHSFGERKNPQAALAAFAQAFPQQRDVALVIKTVGGAQHPDALRRLQELARGDPRVIIRDQVLAREEMLGLQSVCDVFVSLHRSEGFGLALAEAMWLGKPVVATGYSGNLAFMDAANSCLVDYRLVPVREGEYIHGAGQRWAEPDVAHAADWLRRLRQDPGLRQALGARAAQSMRERHSHAAVGARIRQRLEIIAAARRRFAQRR